MKHLLLCLSIFCVCAVTQAQTYDFNNTTDLTTFFTPGSTVKFSSLSTGGIGGSGCINVSDTDLWTSKATYKTGSLTMSAFFYNKINGGYGGLGISPNLSNNLSFPANSTSGLGVVFHGGGGFFISNNSSTYLLWTNDIPLNAWYKMVFSVSMNSDKTFNLVFQIWNADADGNTGTLFIEKTMANVTNTKIATATYVYPYFAATSSRFTVMDNLSVTGVPTGTPEVTTQAVTDIQDLSATGNGTITGHGSSDIFSYGIVWSTETAPVITLSAHTEEKAAITTGVFTSSMTGLEPNTTYYARAYATNASGTSYGNQVSFTTAKQSQTITFASLADKTYGDTDFDPLATASSGLSVTYSSSDETVASVVSGKIHIIKPGSCTIYAGQEGNDTYNAATAVSQTLTVKPGVLTVANAAAQNKEYDGTTAASVIGAELQGVINDDDVSLILGTAAFADADAGVATPVTVTGSSLQGSDKDNYTLAEVTGLTADISPMQITVTPQPALIKVYGDADPVLSFSHSPALLGSDILTGSLSRVEGESVGAYAIHTGSLTAGKNYNISITDASFTITERQLTISDPVVTLVKEYDGTTTTSATAGNLSGVISADEGKVTVKAEAVYDNPSAGTGKTIIVTYLIDGSAAPNYLAPAAYQVTTGVITEKITLATLQPSGSGCEGNTLELPYSIITGDPADYQILFSGDAINAGFSNISYSTLSSSTTSGIISIAIPEGTAHGTFTAQLQLRNSYGFESDLFPFTFSVNLSSDLLVDKFDDVVLCDNSSGLFTSYQWYKNDLLISGATRQYYCDPEGLSGSYYVQVTTTAGQTLKTCPAAFTAIPVKNETVAVYPNPVQAGQTFTVAVSGIDDSEMQGAVLHIYNMSGTKVYTSSRVELLNRLILNGPYGNYIIRVVTPEGREVKAKMLMIGY